MKLKKRKKTELMRLIKETPEARKARVSSGVSLRAVAYGNKKKAALNKIGAETSWRGGACEDQD